jgi:hypothetical protein
MGEGIAMRLQAKLRVSFNTALARRMGESFTTEVAAAFGDEVQRRAKENVMPGRGPGPHPHLTPHEDTGRLAESIQADIGKTASAVTVTVFSDLNYALYNEMGWHTSTGRFVRYQFLRPAITEAQRSFMNLVRSKADVVFAGGARGGAVRVKRQ